MTQQKSNEQLEKEWWEAWWEEDYSWDALKSKIIPGTWVSTLEDSRVFERLDISPDTATELGYREANLQDVWRDQENKLFQGTNGRNYTRFHLPLRSRDNVPEKEKWGEKEIADMNSDLQRKISEVNESYAETSRDPIFFSLQGVVLKRFQIEEILGDVNVAQLELYTDFKQAYFGGLVDFRRVKFNSVSFEGAFFSELTLFGRAHFHRHGKENASGSKVSVNFSNTVFLSEANFSEVSFWSNVSFSNAHFEMNANFLAVTAFENVDFSKIYCRGDFRLRSNYEQEAGGEIKIGKNIDFHRAIFMGISDFEKTIFEGEVNFDDTLFAGSAFFNDIHFVAKFSFTRARFQGVADFSRLDFGEKEENWRWGFNKAVFKEKLSLIGVNIKYITAFGMAVLEGGVWLNPANTLLTKLEKNQCIEDAKNSNNAEDSLFALSYASSALKYACEKDGAILHAYDFYRLELETRRKMPNISVYEKAALFLYKHLSDFGLSIVKPLLYILVVAVFFAMVLFYFLAVLRSCEGEYLNCMTWGGLNSEMLLQSFSFSLSNMFPTGGFRALREYFLKGDAHGFQLLFALFSAIQILISLLLFFLSGLAIRRRFQIS